MRELHFRNRWIELHFLLEPEFRLLAMRSLRNGEILCHGAAGELYADRNPLPPGRFLSYEEHGKNEYLLRYRSGGVDIVRRLFLYENAPAFRYYDVLSCNTAEALADMYYSGLFTLQLEKPPAEAQCVHFFNCTDQSNRRLLRAPARPGKNVGACFLTDRLFLYKEGPQPDCRPIKGEYDFLFKPDSAGVEMVGLGFDNLRPGEERRVFGVTVGLTDDFGLHRYLAARYGTTPTEVLSNSWPELETGVNEEIIARELDLAAESRVDVVFIDDGYFREFMGEINTDKFPNRFYELARRAERLKLQLGLWVNPLGLDTHHPRMELWDGAERADILEQEIHWNFLARTDDFVHTEMYGDCRADRSYNPVELLNEECFEYMKRKLASYYHEYGIRRYKFDLYQLTAFNTIRGDAQLHYEAYRRLIEELKREIPGLVISMDCTRRNRPTFDFALDYGRIFMENRGRKIPDHRYYHPWRAFGNFHRTAQFVPAHRIELEMMPHAMDYPLEYILGTVLFATPLYWGLLANCPPERRAAMKKFFAGTRQLREEFARALVIPVGDAPEQGSWSAVLVLPQQPEKGRSFLAIYRHGAREESWTPANLPVPITGAERRLGSGEMTLTTEGEIQFHESAEYAFSLYEF